MVKTIGVYIIIDKLTSYVVLTRVSHKSVYMEVSLCKSNITHPQCSRDIANNHFIFEGLNFSYIFNIQILLLPKNNHQGHE